MTVYRTKKICIAVVFLCLSLCAITLEAKDYSGHWAEVWIDEWSTKGILHGDGEGNFRPDGQVTRAEMAAFIDRIFRYGEPEVPRSYEDIEVGSWYEDEAIRVASRGGMYLPGGKFLPHQPITRQEVAYAMVQAYDFTDVDDKDRWVYTDQEAIAPWAERSVQALAQKGFMRGYEDGSFRPDAPITRAEVITLIDKLTSSYIFEPGEYAMPDGEEAGSHGGNVVINTGGVTLSDIIIDGNLYITEGADGDSVLLDNVTVTGHVYIDGGDVTLSGSYNAIHVTSKGQTHFVQGRAKAIHVTEHHAYLHLHQATTTEMLTVVEGVDVLVEGVVQKSSHLDLETITLTSAGVYIDGTFVPMTVEGYTLTIDLPLLASEQVDGIMDALVINVNKEGAYIEGYGGEGKLLTNTRYGFRRADQELGMIEDMLDQLKGQSEELATIADMLSLSTDTIFGFITDDNKVSASYMMQEYEMIRDMVFLLLGVELQTTYRFPRLLYDGENPPVTITIQLELE